MNRAVFKYSFFEKFSGIIDWLILAGVVIGPSVMLVVVGMNLEDVDYRRSVADQLAAFMRNSTYLLLLAFIFVSDGLVGRRIIGDAAPLNMLFSRPITRLSYVLSKWLAGSLGSMCLLLAAAGLFQLAVTFLGIKESYVDGYGVASMIATSMGYAALMVFLHCLPGVFGPIAYISVWSISNVGSVLASVPDKGIPWYAVILKQAAIAFDFCFREFIFPSIDIFTLLTSVVFDWKEVIVYVSSIIIFLVAAALIMNRREFFYATE